MSSGRRGAARASLRLNEYAGNRVEAHTLVLQIAKMTWPESMRSQDRTGSTDKIGRGSKEKGRPAQKCYLCLRYIVSLMSSGRTIENMVARDGVEPPTPAFSELVFPVFPTTSMVAVGQPNTGKYEESARTVGDCRG
jgi:hypothetical protein